VMLAMLNLHAINAGILIADRNKAKTIKLQ
jgi:hypothetical protein